MTVFLAYESSPWSTWGVIGVGSTYENAYKCIDTHHEEYGHRSNYTIIEVKINTVLIPTCSPGAYPKVKTSSRI